MAICETLPTPQLECVRLPGLALAAAMKPGRLVSSFRLGPTARARGTLVMLLIGAKSLTASYCRLRIAAGFTAWVSVTPSSRVSPSGAARATTVAPMLPLAPARFSTTTLRPSSVVISCARPRARMSVMPPGL